MSTTTPLRDAMTTDVLTARPGDTVRDAAKAMLDRGVDGVPVVDDGGQVVGMLTSADLIIEGADITPPTTLSFLGAYIQSPHDRHRFDDEVHKKLGVTVGDAMSTDLVTLGPDDTVGDAATAMHSRGVTRIPVVDGEGHLLGLVARGDVLRAVMDLDQGS